MKRLFFTIVLVSSSHLAISQIAKIKSQLKEILFELSIPSSKYDTRKLLHSTDNFSNIVESSHEGYDMIYADFKDNYKLSYLKTSSVRTSSFWFKTGTDSNYAFGFSLKYLPHNVDDCTKQYNEITNFFKPISFKASIDPWIADGIKRGEWFSAYSSSKQVQKGKAYINMTMSLEKPCEKCTDQNTYYWIDFSFYEQSLK